MNKKKKIKLFITVLLFAFLVTACSDDDNEDDKIVMFKAELKGSNEVPSNTSEAKGTTLLTFNKKTMMFSATTTYTGLTPTGGQISMAEKGTRGPVIYQFGTKLESPIVYQSALLTETQVKALMDENLYVNLPTSLHPGGEIRGQLEKQ